MDETPPPAVAITSIEIGFWNLVTFCIKFLLAMTIAIGLIAALAFVLVLLNIVSFDFFLDR